jgi:hypothetical protein
MPSAQSTAEVEGQKAAMALHKPVGGTGTGMDVVMDIGTGVGDPRGAARSQSANFEGALVIAHIVLPSGLLAASKFCQMPAAHPHRIAVC